MQMPVKQWLDTVRKEYLDDFITHGGAAVKFAVLLEMEKQKELVDQLEDLARRSGFLYVKVDSAQTKIHMIDKLFHAIAKSIDWDDLNYRFLRRLLEKNDNISYKLPEQRDEFNMNQLALLNKRVKSELRNELRGLLENSVYYDYAMSQEYRIAMIQISRSILDPEDVALASAAQSIKEWLTGELRLLSTLKKAAIFQKIVRHNSRHMLCSLAHWLKLSGQSGLVLCLDISRYVSGIRPVDQENCNYYSPSAVLDAYEVLRQFIDSTDELESTLTIVIAPNEFLSDDKRGVKRYDALKLRIIDEVRDKRANPFASLIRLCSECPAEVNNY